ncbi:hypothetical protein O3P69_000412 [Scylla paramamosain]|uniref:Uncharacterized protein n=1 Tax=Scylla paramamosain TaxID=85552 RepID=A0AAW0USZ7_SCYPA
MWKVDLEPRGKLHVIIELKWVEPEDGSVHPWEGSTRLMVTSSWQPSFDNLLSAPTAENLFEALENKGIGAKFNKQSIGVCYHTGGNMESKWKKLWETCVTQEQEAHLTGNLVTGGGDFRNQHSGGNMESK